MIKVCGMRDPENLRSLIEIKPDMIGMIFYPASPRYVMENVKLASIMREEAGDIKLVGVFVNQCIKEIKDLNELFNFSYLQLHGNESPEFCKEIKSAGPGVIKAFGISSEFDLRKTEFYEGLVDFFLFDTKTSKHGGSGKKFNWKIMDSYKGKTPFLLSGGIGPDDFPEIENPAYAGIDLNSRFETAPGMKDISLLKNYLKKYRHDQ